MSPSAPIPPPPPPDRGTGIRPSNRFDSLHRETVEEWMEVDPEEAASPRTQIFLDQSESVLVKNNSPDVGFDWSLNPYRGCEHGCSYCYARPTHEYLGWDAGVDFETRILVKANAANHLERELLRPSWLGEPINMSGVTDCYQPLERQHRITRACLEVLARFRQPVTLITKNALILRDLDYLRELARHKAVSVFISVTTLDPELRRRMEPRASPPKARLRTIEQLAAAGVPVGVLVAPVVPALNDHEMLPILAASASAGASFASYVVLRLPLSVEPVFCEWLQRHYPDRFDKVLNQLKAFRGGQRNSSEFGVRMRGTGAVADRLSQMLHIGCKRHGLGTQGPELSRTAFRRVEPGQLPLELF